MIERPTLRVSDSIGTDNPRVAARVHFTRFDPVTDTLPANLVRYLAAGGVIFTFTPVKLPDGRYRAYIRQQPLDYRGHDTSAHGSHRLSDRHGPYVCWTPEPIDPNEMLKVMRVWAESTLRYISTGSFGPPR